MPLYQYLPSWRNRWTWLPPLVGLLVFPLMVSNEYVLRIAVLVGIYVILTASLNITNGYTGLFSFGHAAFYGIGAYTAAILATRHGVPAWATLPLAAMVAGLFGAAIALPTLRLTGIFLALVTIGFQEIVYLVILNWVGLTRGPMGIPGIPPPRFWGIELTGNRGYYYLILGLNVLVLFLIARMANSRLGRAFVAIREEEIAASSAGVPTFRLKVLAFVISTCFAGLAGAFFAHHARYVSADSFRLDETFIMLTMLIVGGMGSWLGPIIGAAFLVILPEASRFLAEYRGVVYGLILIAVILFRPEGIAGVPGIIQVRGPFSRRERQTAGEEAS
jgi:branched-chain amino acid transport system permease protein